MWKLQIIQSIPVSHTKFGWWSVLKYILIHENNPWKCCSTALWIKTMHNFYRFQQHQNFTCCLSHSKTCHAWLWELKHHRPSDSGTDDNVTRLVAYCFSSCVPVPLPLLCTLKYWIFRSYSLTKVGQEVGTSLLSSTVHTDGRKSVNISLLSCYFQSYLLCSVSLTLFSAKKCLKFLIWGTT